MVRADIGDVIIDTTGRVLAGPWRQTFDFDGDYARVTCHEGFGYVGVAGQVAPCIYSSPPPPFPFRNGVAFAATETHGVHVPVSPTGATLVEDRLVIGKRAPGERLSLMFHLDPDRASDVSGLDIVLEEILHCEDGSMVVSTHPQSGIIDASGRFVVPLSDHHITGCLTEGRAPFLRGGAFGEYGFVDASAEVVVPARYAWVWPYSEGLAGVCLRDEATSALSCGYIDREGAVVVPLTHRSTGQWPNPDALGPFRGGFAHQTNLPGVGPAFLDRSGRIVARPRFDVSLPGFPEDGLIPFLDLGVEVTIDRDGNVLKRESNRCNIMREGGFSESPEANRLARELGCASLVGAEDH
jgi:hypothetical protein